MPIRSNLLVLNRNETAASARSFAYRFLAEAFAYPEVEGWHWLQSREPARALVSAADNAWQEQDAIRKLTQTVGCTIQDLSLDTARLDHLRAFGYTIRSACPPHEIEYGDTKADALFRPHRLADLSALYRVFGLEMGEETHERQDHLAIECEFASILAARSAHALQRNEREACEVCEEAWKLFLREHLARWTPAFSSRLQGVGAAEWLQQATALLLAIVRADCATLGIRPGSPDVQLISYDESDDAYCTEECGLAGHNPANA